MSARHRDAMPTRAHAGLGVLAAVWLACVGPVACGGADNSPEQSARNFIAAVRARNAEAVLAQLDQASREQLERMAEVATDRVGGRRVVEVEELLQVVSVDPEFDVDASSVIEQSDTAARVELVAPSGKKEIVSLVRQDGSWRVVLPGIAAPAAP